MREPIAIVGLGLRVSGAADPESYWRMLSNGEVRFQETPPERFDAARLFDPDPAAPGKIVTTRGSFIEHPDRVDLERFGWSGADGSVIDPQQRLLLEAAADALDDAGIPPEHLAGSRTMVAVALGPDDYPRLQLSKLEHIGPNTLAGNAVALAANRISYQFDLHGPSFVVESACSSSLLAIHLALRALEHGEASAAIAGAACLILRPELTVVASKTGALSRDGACRPFEARANGYLRGEGVGAVVLKPLSRAIADRDPIRALIVGSGISHNGRSNGVTAPNRFGQQAAITGALADAGIGPQAIRYVEAHGTATPIGDLIEAQALGAALGAGRPADRRLPIGSLKANLGNLEAASGVAALIKVVLALEHRVIPGMPGFEAPNPAIPFAQLGLEPCGSQRPWPPGEGPLRAGVSAFGLGGANLHLVVEEAPPAATGERALAPALVAISARSEADLVTRARTIREHLGSHHLHDVAWSLGPRARHFTERLALIVASGGELAEALQGWLEGRRDPRVLRGTTPRRLPRRGTAPKTDHLEEMARLYLAGHHPSELFDLPAARFVRLPGAPARRRRCWSEPEPAGQ